MKKIYAGIISFNILAFGLFFLFDNYPWPIVLLHLISVFGLCGYAVFRLLSGLKIENKEYLLLGFLFIFSFILRMYKIDTLTPGIQGDEMIVAYSARELGTNFTPFTTSNFGHGTLIPYMVRLSVNFFGDTIASIRLPSVLFGCIGVLAFYLLLRLFFKRPIATLGGLFFAFSYSMLSLSRVIYEPTAAIFFQVMALIFLLLSEKRKGIYYIGLGLMLGLGNYTYINFRLFTIFVFIYLFVRMLARKRKWREEAKGIGLVGAFSFIGMMPLVHYFIVNPDQFVIRARVLSLFNQGLTFQDIVSNIVGSIGQLQYIFVNPGDPNFRINPGKTAMVDILTLSIFLVGIGSLFKKYSLILIFFFLSVPFLLSDIFAYEAGPANTFFGFAHPNTLRISGILPFILIVVTFGISALSRVVENSLKENSIKQTQIEIMKIVSAIILAGIGFFINTTMYFSQPFDPYTYSVNGVLPLKLVAPVKNMSTQRTVSLSPFLKEDIRFEYFLGKNPANVKKFDPKNVEEAIGIIDTTDMTVIDSSFNVDIIRTLVEKNPTNKKIYYHQAPNGVDAFLFVSPDQIAIDEFFPI